MSDFKNVTGVKEANVYLKGQVASGSVFSADGAKKNPWHYASGEYEFGTGAAGVMEILSGGIDVFFAGS